MQSAFVFNTNPIIYFVYFLCSCSAAVGCLGRWWALLRQSPRQCFWATVFPFQQSISPWLLLFPLLPFRIWFSLAHTLSLSQQSLYYHFNTTADVLLTPLIYPLYKDSWWAEEKLWLCLLKYIEFPETKQKRTEKDKEITLVNIEENKNEEIHDFIIIITLSYRRKKKGTGLCEKGSTNLTGKNLKKF